MDEDDLGFDKKKGSKFGLDLQKPTESEAKGETYQSKNAFLNNLDGQITLVERTAKKLAPIYNEVLDKIKPIEKPIEKNNDRLEDFSSHSAAAKAGQFDSDIFLAQLQTKWNDKKTTAS
jgi:hypothetical protein